MKDIILRSLVTLKDSYQLVRDIEDDHTSYGNDFIKRGINMSIKHALKVKNIISIDLSRQTLNGEDLENLKDMLPDTLRTLKFTSDRKDLDKAKELIDSLPSLEDFYIYGHGPDVFGRDYLKSRFKGSDELKRPVL